MLATSDGGLRYRPWVSRSPANSDTVRAFASMAVGSKLADRILRAATCTESQVFALAEAVGVTPLVPSGVIVTPDWFRMPFGSGAVPDPRRQTRSTSSAIALVIVLTIVSCMLTLASANSSLDARTRHGRACGTQVIWSKVGPDSVIC